jgi:hypothetical protein
MWFNIDVVTQHSGPTAEQFKVQMSGQAMPWHAVLSARSNNIPKTVRRHTRSSPTEVSESEI